MDSLQTYLWSIVHDYEDGKPVSEISEDTDIPVEDVIFVLIDIGKFTEHDFAGDR
jgi:hypothetical protein